MNRKSDRIEWIYAALGALGAVIAAFLTSFHYSAGAAQRFCTQAAGCGSVNQSAYSQIHGVPIAIFGLASYIVVVALALLAQGGWRYREWVPVATFGIALCGVLFSLYLSYLEVYVLHAICPWCVASAVVLCGLLVTSLADLLWLRRGPLPPRRT
jgi:uncharacterized membrane protein